MLLYATAAVPWIWLNEEIRPFARRIEEIVPRDATLVAYGLDDYAPLLATLFYLGETKYVYAPEAGAAPPGEHYYLVRGKDQRKFNNRFAIDGAPLASWKPEGEAEPTLLVRAALQPR